jgi:OFA family oxalate/formate antiporter-like MFS transporter
MSSVSSSYSPGGLSNRWLQAVLALVAMIMISPYEYTFTLFESPLAKAHHWTLPSVSLTFTIYVAVAALFMIPSGIWSDKWQPRWFTTVAGLVTGLGWIISAHAATHVELYLAYGIGSLGPGYIYANGVNNALKWFPEAKRRGVAVGLIDMGFGAGSAIFIPILAGIIATGVHGYQQAFQDMGIAMIVIIVIVAQFLRYPEKGWLPPGYHPESDLASTTSSRNKVANTTYQFTPTEVLKTWQFWVAWIAMSFICAAGLMITAHIVDIAKVDVAVAAAAVGVTAATLSRLPNGGMRWVSGIVSDYIGRELSMFIAFVIMGIALFWMANTHNGILFIILACVAMGMWGPLFTLFPALMTDYYGREHSAVNYGMMYTGKAVGGIFGGILASTIYVAAHNSYKPDFYLAAAFAVVAGLLAMFVLKRPTAVPKDVPQHKTA